VVGHIKKVAQVNNHLDELQEWAEDEIEELQETIGFVLKHHVSSVPWTR